VGLVLAGWRWQLDRMAAAAAEQQRAANAGQLGSLDRTLSAAQTLGVDQEDLAFGRARAATLAQENHRDQTLKDLEKTATGIDALRRQAQGLNQAQRAENVALQEAAARLTSQYGAQLEALRRAGRSALAEGRNDGTIAAFLKLQTGRLDRALEKYGPLIGSADAGQAALGVAGAQRYGKRMHDALLGHAPGKLILVSLAAQRLQAFQDGRLVQETLVTTGRPNLSTDIGPMQVVRKSSPWTMQSPWPKGSPYWYPDTPVKMVLWFTNTGEGMHDADWEPLSAYGPGSHTGPFASHGCIHVPPAAEQFLFDWAPIGTPVVIYPGDGVPVADQIAQRSVNDKGEPLGAQPSGV
jgi:L,D-transpeptidase-like protein